MATKYTNKTVEALKHDENKRKNISTAGHDVFISYATPDKSTADAICHFLEEEGIRCWIAPRDIPSGSLWAAVIPDAIQESKVMVLVLSSRANDSIFVSKEVTLASNYGRFIVPFRIEDFTLSGGLEFHLADLHWINALTPPQEAHI